MAYNKHRFQLHRVRMSPVLTFATICFSARAKYVHRSRNEYTSVLESRSKLKPSILVSTTVFGYWEAQLTVPNSSILSITISLMWQSNSALHILQTEALHHRIATNWLEYSGSPAVRQYPLLQHSWQFFQLSPPSPVHFSVALDLAPACGVALRTQMLPTTTSSTIRK